MKNAEQELKKRWSDEEEENILEELSQQVARKDDVRQKLGLEMHEINKRIKKMALKRRPSIKDIHDLPKEDRSKVFAILELLDELKFLSTEANEDYMLNCWLDIKSKYSKLSREGKRLASPKIKQAVKPLGKQFKI